MAVLAGWILNNGLLVSVIGLVGVAAVSLYRLDKVEKKVCGKVGEQHCSDQHAHLETIIREGQEKLLLKVELMTKDMKEVIGNKIGEEMGKVHNRITEHITDGSRHGR